MPDIREYAIDDDDESSQWEDSDDDSNYSIYNKLEFKRIGSKPNLTSRRSLITIALTQSNTQQPKHSADSQSMLAPPRAHTPPNGLQGSSNDSDGPLMMKDPCCMPPIKSVNEIALWSPIPIMTANGIAYQPMSSRTARRTMLSTELTESLRLNMLREREYHNAPTPKDTVPDLRQLPEHEYITSNNDKWWS